MTNIKTPKSRGEIFYNASLSRYNTWNVGGNAECIFHPADLDDLSDFLAGLAQDIPVTWLGLGSNVLIRDGGIDGVTIVTQSGLKEIEFNDDSVVAQAGVACAKLARASVSKGFSGIEFLAGIPGTVGGALAMNAGAFGGQTWDNIDYVNCINRMGEIYARDVSEYEFGYRFVEQFNGEWFVGAKFKLTTASEEANIISIKDLLAQRSASQPIGKKNCGSVFKNPKGGYAAQLIEQNGLKGFSIGGASVSDKHANFILNEDNASADDIEQLISYVKKIVKQKSQVELIPEVKILGKPA